jgi:hypothetical protein
MVQISPVRRRVEGGTGEVQKVMQEGIAYPNLHRMSRRPCPFVHVM